MFKSKSQKIGINSKSNMTSKIGLQLYKYAFKYPKTIFFQNNDDLQLFSNLKLAEANSCDVLPGSGVDLEKFAYSPKIETDKIVFLMILGVVSSKTGRSSQLKAVLRITIWGTLAMGLSALAGSLFGTIL